MTKKLLTGAMLLMASAAACAQGSIVIYGIADTGYVKEGGTDLRMDGFRHSMLGFRGSEYLGGGNYATFNLEKRFFLNNGVPEDDHESFSDRVQHELTGSSGPDWQGPANVGLKGYWGNIQFGRVFDIAVENYLQIDPFNMHSTGAALSKYSRLRTEFLNNSVRYESPRWSGLGFLLTYTLKSDDKIVDPAVSDILNNGFSGSINYDNGPIKFISTFSRLADSNKSYAFNAGIAYEFGSTTLSLGYHHTRVKELHNLGSHAGHAHAHEFESLKQRELLVGLDYILGPHNIKATYNYGKVSDRENIHGENANGHAHKVALGYIYSFSRRTDLYAIASYTNSSNEHVGGIYNNNETGRKSMTGIQLGMTHLF